MCEVMFVWCHVWCLCLFEVMCDAHVCMMLRALDMCIWYHVWCKCVMPMCVWYQVWCPCVFDVRLGANVCLLSCVVPIFVCSHVWCPVVFGVIWGAHNWLMSCVVPMCHFMCDEHVYLISLVCLMSSVVLIWDKMCRKNSDQIHVLFSPSLWLQCALLCLPGSLELGWSLTTPPCESPQVISLGNSKCHFIFMQLFLEKLKTDITPQPLELLTFRKWELGLIMSYLLVLTILCDSHQHLLQIETILSFLHNHSHPQSSAINYKF